VLDEVKIFTMLCMMTTDDEVDTTLPAIFHDSCTISEIQNFDRFIFFP